MKKTIILTLFTMCFTYYIGCENASEPSTQTDLDKSSQIDPDEATEKVMNRISSTPQGREIIETQGGKDVQLSRFQKDNGISDQIAEAAIKEWVLTHNGNFEWNLEDVKTICLRNKRNGIPSQYQPG